METQAPRAPVGTGVSPESPTRCQAPQDSQDRKESQELQGNEAQLGVQDCRGSPASPRLPTSLGCLVTKGRQGYSACKVTEDPQGPPGLPLFLEAKETRETREQPESQAPRVGSETLGPRVGLGFLVSQEKKGPWASKDLWATPEQPALWVTGDPRDPKETRVFQVPPAL